MFRTAVKKNARQVSAGNPYRGRLALAALVAMGAAACAEDDPVTPEPEGGPGTIVLTTHTSGFFKDDSYELIVNGESRGTIEANGEMTIPDLFPATYEVDLGDVAENCAAESTSVEVGEDETHHVSLSVVCSYGAPTSYTLRFSRERPDLDSGEITVCSFGICPTSEGWDLYIYNDSQSTPHSVIRQNQTTAVEIAHLPDVALDDLTEEHLTGASFTTEQVPDSFDAGRVILLRTDTGAVFALGNPVEDMTALTLTFDAALIAQP